VECIVEPSAAFGADQQFGETVVAPGFGAFDNPAGAACKGVISAVELVFNVTGSADATMVACSTYNTSAQLSQEWSVGCRRRRRC
jgi:hypothetical protein